MRLRNIKDCKNCDKALVFGSKYAPVIKCDSCDFEHLKTFREYGRHGACYCTGYNETTMNRCGALNQDCALQFILAGNSEFILHSTKTNDDFMYCLTKQEQKDNKNKFIYFVNLIHGHEKTYAGILVENEETKELEFKQGKSGKVDSTEISVRSLVFVINKLLKGETVGNLEFYHTGKCGCCGSKLVSSENIECGYCAIHIKEMKA